MIDFDDPLKGQPRLDSEGRWPTPTDRKGASPFQRFTYNYAYSPADFHRQDMHYEKEMLHAFRGRRVEVLDHELKNLAGHAPTGEVDPNTGARSRERFEFQREFFKLEMDAWIKEPDPVVTAWERFKLWLTRKPYPKAKEPDRIVVYYSMSRRQANVFRRLWVNELS